MIVWAPKEVIGGFVSREINAMQHLPWGEYSALGLVADDALIAGVIYNHYMPGGSICMSVAATKENWLTRDFLFASFDYPFRALALQRVTAFVTEGNEQSARFVEHLGFVKEGTMRRALPTGEALIVYGMLKEECKWVSESFAEHVWQRLVMRSGPPSTSLH